MSAISYRFESVSGRLVNGQTNQRTSKRQLVVAPCVIYYQESRHVGLIRDISVGGLFAYSDFQPSMGDAVSVIVTERSEKGAKTVACTGIVVRVESKAAGAATGIAVQVSGYEVV